MNHFSNRYSRLMGILVLGTMLSASQALACGNEGAACGAKQAACGDHHAASDAVFMGEGASAQAPQGDVQKAVLSVKGMMCSSCVQKVAGALKKMDGVQSVSVQHKKGLVEIAYVGKANPQDMVKAVTSAGFEASLKN